MKYFSCKTGIKPRNATSMVKKKKKNYQCKLLFVQKKDTLASGDDKGLCC